MITRSELNKMSELDLIRLIKDPKTLRYDFDRACEFLIKKYEPMIGKHWYILRKQMDDSSLVLELKDDFYSEAYGELLKVVEKVDLDRLYNEEFKLMQLFSWYLSNLRGRYIKDILKRGRVKGMNNMNQETEDGDSVIDLDIEKAYWDQGGYRDDPAYTVVEIRGGKEACKEAIKKCLSKWNEKEKQVFTYLNEGKSRKEVAEIMGYNSVKIWNVINKMKKDMKKELGLEH